MPPCRLVADDLLDPLKSCLWRIGARPPVPLGTASSARIALRHPAPAARRRRPAPAAREDPREWN